MFYYFNAEMKYREKPPTLNEATWDYIRQAAQDGTASDLWSVGDRKEITLNGTCRARTFNNYKVYAYILGFNHNAALEGDKTITFQIGFDALSGGNHIALTDWTDSKDYGSDTGIRFSMNDTGTNVGGWKDSLMRITTIPEFIACLPSDLQDVLKVVNKYTDNGTGSKHQTNTDVTATQDKAFLLSEFEIFGSRTWANQYEQNSQLQYDYYKNGNSKIMYNDQRTGTAVTWVERSPDYRMNTGFGTSDATGNVNVSNTVYSIGFAPAFVVG